MPEPKVWTIALYNCAEELSLSRAVELFNPIIERWKLDVRQTELKLPDWKTYKRPPLHKIKLLVREQPATTFESLCLYPSAKLHKELGYSRFELSFGNWQKRLVISIDEGIVGCEVPHVLAEQLSELCRQLRPRCGFMSLLDALPLSPIFYSSGIGHDALDEISQKRIHDFGDDYHFGQTYLSSKLRDLYLWNVVSDSHLEAPVGKEPLRTWIERGSRGTLSKITGGTWLWKVELAEFRDIRSKLLLNGLLVVSI